MEVLEGRRVGCPGVAIEDLDVSELPGVRQHVLDQQVVVDAERFSGAPMISTSCAAAGVSNRRTSTDDEYTGAPWVFVLIADGS